MGQKATEEEIRIHRERTASVTQYPNLTCYWDIYFGNLKVSAYEVTGLNESIDLIPWRQGSDTEGFKQVQVDKPTQSRLTVKWGVFTEGYNGAHVFQLWRDARSYYNDSNSIDILVTLLDENQNPVLYWICRNCIPVEYQGPSLKADESAIAMQTLVMTTSSIRSEYVFGAHSRYHNFLKRYKEQYAESTVEYWEEDR